MQQHGGPEPVVSPRAFARLIRIGLVGLAACLAGALAASAASAHRSHTRVAHARAHIAGGSPVDDSGEAFQILAPGAEGELRQPAGPFATDQGELYSALTPLEGKVTKGDIVKDYLSEKFASPGEAGDTEESTPRMGLEIWRDSHDIPHIFGETRSDVMYGSGWVAAKDRGLLLVLGLGPAYVAALSVPGLNAFELLLNDRSFKPSKEATEFVENQVEVLRHDGARGEQVIEDLEAWAEGVNAYEETLPEHSLEHIGKKVTLADAIAGFAFIGSIFGNGGGNEVVNSNFLAKLEAKFGEEEGLKIFHALRESNDPEAPTSAKTAFNYDQEPEGKPPAGAAVIEPGSIGPATRRALKALQTSHHRMSNWLLIGSESTKKKHSIAVMGPQLGYYYPEIVYQEDLHGPGIDAQGIAAPISPYVFIGRGRDFAWSLTSASSENEQQFLLKLCNPEPGGEVTASSEYYEQENASHELECNKQMTTFDAGELGKAGSEPAHEVYFKESVYGPVIGTVKVHGQLYAIAQDRSTRGREPAGEIAFSDLDSDRVHSPQQFFEAANELETTFNMSYIDDTHAAFFSTGRLPKLAPETDPALPTFGTGKYNWRGFLSLEEHPHEVITKGELLNWNNKPAPGWGAASNVYSYGPIHRVQLYRGFKEKMKEENDVSIMNRAATEDLRALLVWPTVEKVLAGESAPSTLASEAMTVLKKWIKSGASLVGPKRPKAAGAAVMDSVFDPVQETVLGGLLGEELTNEFKTFTSVDNNRNSGGSSFGEGWYGYVDKDLRTLLGEPVAQPYEVGFCGDGSLTACRKSLWAAIQTALEKTKEEEGGLPPKKWLANEVVIEFPPGVLKVENKEHHLVPYTMPWTNRSTFQQVIEFTSHQEECTTETLEVAAENCKP